jgi:small subunit ribosomal protein S15
MLTTDKKVKIIKEFATGPGDTGSPQVQVALLSNQITDLVGHLKEHKKDNHSRRGLLKIISKRRRLLNYLAKVNADAYQDTIKKLKIGKES